MRMACARARICLLMCAYVCARAGGRAHDNSIQHHAVPVNTKKSTECRQFVKLIDIHHLFLFELFSCKPVGYNLRCNQLASVSYSMAQ